MMINIFIRHMFEQHVLQTLSIYGLELRSMDIHFNVSFRIELVEFSFGFLLKVSGQLGWNRLHWLPVLQCEKSTISKFYKLYSHLSLTTCV